MPSMHRESPGQNKEESHPPRSSWKRGRSSLRRHFSKTWSSTCLPATCRSPRGEVRSKEHWGQAFVTDRSRALWWYFTAWHVAFHGVWGPQKEKGKCWGFGCGVCNSLEGEPKATRHSNELIPAFWYRQPKPSTLQVNITRLSHNSFLRRGSILWVPVAKHTSRAITLKNATVPYKCSLPLGL